MVEEKHDDKFLRTHVEKTERSNKTLQHYVTKGPGIKPIRPEYLAAVLDELADDDAMFFVDTGTPCIWAARHIHYGAESAASSARSRGPPWPAPHRTPSEPNSPFPGRQTIALCGDGGFTMLAMGDLLTEVQRRQPSSTSFSTTGCWTS